MREMLYVLQRGPGMQAGMTAALAVANAARDKQWEQAILFGMKIENGGDAYVDILKYRIAHPTGRLTTQGKETKG